MLLESLRGAASVHYAWPSMQRLSPDTMTAAEGPIFGILTAEHTSTASAMWKSRILLLYSEKTHLSAPHDCLKVHWMIGPGHLPPCKSQAYAHCMHNTLMQQLSPLRFVVATLRRHRGL